MPFASRVIVGFFAVAVSLLSGAVRAQDEPVYREELIFPLRSEHNHAPGIVECPNGDLIASWYRGSGERRSDDVAIYGARLRKGASQWSADFVMADFPGFPDCNTAMLMDNGGRLWLFWPTVIANTWESAITNFLISRDYDGDGRPKWDWHGIVLLKPDQAEFEQQIVTQLDALLKNLKQPLTERQENYVKEVRRLAGDKLYQRLGWMPRCKPTVLPSGRILLPLYSDTYSASLMAISDDNGKTWFPSKLIVGYGNIQPAVLRRNDGTLVAYMRENGFEEYIRVSESKDDGVTWGPVYNAELNNPGAGIDAVRLANGNWVMIYNDTTQGRNSLALSLSDDEGQTWKWKRHLEHHEKGAFHYPAIIQGADGTIHGIYSYFKQDGDKEGKSMKHVAVNEAWIRAGGEPTK